MLGFRLKIFGGKLFFMFVCDESKNDFLIIRIPFIWQYWYMGKIFKDEVCKFYSFIDKYDFDGKEIKIINNNLDALKNKYWYSTPPSAFNDIADFNSALLTFSKTRKKYKKQAELDNVKKISDEEVQRIAEEAQMDIYNNNSGVTCFSHSKNIVNHLMWAHYAEEHKGICIKFKSIVQTGIPQVLLPVTYIKKNPGLNDKDVLFLLPFIKASCWKYEREQRLVTYSSYFTFSEHERKIKFSSANVSSIYFGNRFEKNKYHQVILEIIFNNYSQVDLFSIELCTKKIRLYTKRVTIEKIEGNYKLK
jgi:hypothetical protein